MPLRHEWVDDNGRFEYFPMGSYDVIISMNFLETHGLVTNCLNKTFTCINELGEHMTIVGFHRVVLVQQLSTIQVKTCVRKGCTLYAIHV